MKECQHNIIVKTGWRITHKLSMFPPGEWQDVAHYCFTCGIKTNSEGVPVTERI